MLKVNPCANVNCLNGGTCTLNAQNQPVCVCPQCYSGQFCATLNPCCSNPCLNGGACTVNANNQAVCTCPQCYSGQFCATYNPCCSNPCLNGGACVVNGNSYTCSCLQNYFGPNCGTCKFKFYLTFFSLAFFESTFNPFKVNPCASVSCLNGGTCTVNANNQAVCNCRQGYSGPFCGTFDVCASQPCLNGGFCIQTGNSYSCVCIGNYIGANCGTCNLIKYFSPLCLCPLFHSLNLFFSK